MKDGVITTKRLVLRPFSMSDADALIAGLDNLDVSKWTGPVPHPYSAADATEFLEGYGRSPWIKAVTLQDALIGCVDAADGVLGYWLAQPCWGQGFATEAAQALVAAFFQENDVDILASGFFEGNTASEGVLRKLGFVKTGTGTAYSTARRSDVPHFDMHLSRSAWEALS